MESTLLDLSAFSPAARALRAAMELVIARANGGDRRSASYRMMYSSAADASLSGMQINGGIRGPWLGALLDMANGKYARGLGRLVRGAVGRSGK